MIQESGQASLFPEAEKRLERLFRLDPHNPKQYFTAALLATDMKKFELAEQYFKQSLQVFLYWCGIDWHNIICA